MKSSKYMLNGKLLDMSGYSYELLNDGEKRFFAVVLQSGHCGQGYFIPLIKSAMVKDIDTAIEYLKSTGRIKRMDNKHCVLGACEINEAQHLLIKEINVKDSYYVANHETDEYELFNEINKRKIAMPDIVSYNKKLKHGFEDIKLAEDYPDDCVVERYCAPYRSGDKIIYPKNINMKQLLDEFFYEKVKILGITNNITSIITLYYSIYGADNKLGITYLDGKIYYTDANGDDKEYELSDKARKYVDRAEQQRINSTKETSEDEEPQYTPTSRIDRFYKRFEKHRNNLGKNS